MTPPPKEVPEADEQPSASLFLTIDDLAKRWGVKPLDARKIVREGCVPFIALREVDMRVNWFYVRFEPAAVEAWERSRERTFPNAPPAPPQRIAFRKIK